MTKLEIACIIIGFIMFIDCSPDYEDEKDKSPTPIEISRHIMIGMVVTRIVCGLMILLPLYFRYWR